MSTNKQAASTRVRTTIMAGIQDHIRARNLTQVEAAKLCGISQPRLCNLMQGQVEKFSIDALVRIASSANLRIVITIM